jgi:hypothetical protein
MIEFYYLNLFIPLFWCTHIYDTYMHHTASAIPHMFPNPLFFQVFSRIFPRCLRGIWQSQNHQEAVHRPHQGHRSIRSFPLSLLSTPHIRQAGPGPLASFPQKERIHSSILPTHGAEHLLIWYKIHALSLFLKTVSSQTLNKKIF